MRRLGQLLLHVRQLLDEGFEVQLYDYFVGTSDSSSERVEDVRFEGLSLREQVLRLQQIGEELEEVKQQLKELDVD